MTYFVTDQCLKSTGFGGVTRCQLLAELDLQVLQQRPIFFFCLVVGSWFSFGLVYSSE